MVQNGTVVHLVQFVAAYGSVKKMYKPDDPDDWTGLVWYGNRTEVPRDRPICGWDNGLCKEDKDGFHYMTLVVFIGLILLVSMVLAIFGVWKYQRKTKIRVLDQVQLKWSDVSLLNIHSNEDHTNEEVVLLKGEQVIMEIMQNVDVDAINNTIIKELMQLQQLTNDNISKFIGVCLELGHVSIFMAWQSRGSLWNIIEDDNIEFDLDFKTSIVTDIACGMAYLHQSPIGAHGRLTSKCCYIDNRWTCTISGYGLKTLRQKAGKGEELFIQSSDYLWIAPELLGKHGTDQPHLSMTKSDIYSYGIIVQEVILEDKPYAFNDIDIQNEIINGRPKPMVKPTIPLDVPENWQQLMIACWKDDLNKRPTFGEILYRLRLIDKSIELTLVEKIVHRLEKHTRLLEEIVEKRKMEIKNEKHKMEYLLEELLPISVIEQLQIGKKVEPETFDDVTLFFSDIVGFTCISAKSSPMQIVAMLSNLYTCFDNVASMFDVYKVATIGDAYMVASGIPIRNGDQHGAEICGMALALMEAIQDLTIDHLRDKRIEMRIGIHSGSCVGGVVGNKMPRYFLFGDTVDVASRMESSGETMKIHVSQSTKWHIDDKAQFKIELRGETYIKGKGLMKTYWLSFR